MDEYRAELTGLLKAFGGNVRRLRTAKRPRVSQERLALDVGLHRTEVGKIERGLTEPRLSTIMILAQGLSVGLDEMVAGLEVPTERKPPAASNGHRA